MRIRLRHPRRSRPLELNDVFERERVERRLVALALQQIEQGEPRERRELGVGVVLDPLFQELACDLRLTARKAQRRIFEHRAKPGVRLRDFERRLRGRPLDEARTGHVMSPGSTGNRPPFATCEASSRADAARPVPTDTPGRDRTSGLGSGGFLAGGLEKNAIAK